eukprot:g4741.t1
MGGRFSRVHKITRVPKPVTPDLKSPVLRRTEERNTSIERDEVLEERDPVLDANLNQLFGSITSTDTIFVPGSDPISAERKRKARREHRRKLISQRISTATFKSILTEHGKRQVPDSDQFVAQLAEKYEVDKKLLGEVLRHYRFPPLYKRYDGYVVADRWD